LRVARENIDRIIALRGMDPIEDHHALALGVVVLLQAAASTSTPSLARTVAETRG